MAYLAYPSTIRTDGMQTVVHQYVYMYVTEVHLAL